LDAEPGLRNGGLAARMGPVRQSFRFHFPRFSGRSLSWLALGLARALPCKTWFKPGSSPNRCCEKHVALGRHSPRWLKSFARFSPRPLVFGIASALVTAKRRACKHRSNGQTTTGRLGRARTFLWRRHCGFRALWTAGVGNADPAHGPAG